MGIKLFFFYVEYRKGCDELRLLLEETVNRREAAAATHFHQLLSLFASAVPPHSLFSVFSSSLTPFLHHPVDRPASDGL